MKVVEIRNNLVKIEFESDEGLVLGRFIVLASEQNSYVAQIINIKIDEIQKHAIAKLMFTFTNDGVVDNYDGSIPDMNSEASLLPAQELLDLLPVETAVKFGHLAQEDSVLSLDISIFEHNMTVFSDHDFEKRTFISNCVNQLANMNEKSVVIDDANLFENVKKCVPGRDFKLPLNSEMIDYLFDNELTDIGTDSKAVIKDIFYAVQQYIDTLDNKFLPIDKFVDVIASQYQQNNIPELALLKNKLLKYKDSNLFANSEEEINVIANMLDTNNTIYVDIKDFSASLQNKIINIIHNELNLMSGYIYFFVPIRDDNSDKPLIRKFINHSHIFTTIFASHAYKYAAELKEHAENIVLYTPQTITHEFASYNTFLNKLNHDEFVIYGKLTQGIPFIVESEVVEPQNFAQQEAQIIKQELEQKSNVESYSEVEQGQYSQKSEIPEQFENKTILEPVENIMSDDELGQEENIEQDLEEEQVVEQEDELDEVVSEGLPEDEEYMEHPNISEIASELQEPLELDLPEDELSEEDLVEDDLSEEDLDYIDDALPTLEEPEAQGEDIADISEDDLYSQDEEEFDKPPVVPIYPAEGVESEAADDAFGYAQGDVVTHPRYGRGVIEKIIKYGNKTLCSISFDNVGRRLLDPSISEFEKE
jgi:hypothetical protein